MKIFLAVMLWVISGVGSLATSQSNGPLAVQPPGNCEANSRRLDSIRNKSQATEAGKVTIVIARLGKGERLPEINRRRLYTVRTYLTAMGLPPQKLVTAEGERVSGYGGIEIYIGGELIDFLTAEPCKEIPVGMCENVFEDARQYQLARKGKVGRCR